MATLSLIAPLQDMSGPTLGMEALLSAVKDALVRTCFQDFPHEKTDNAVSHLPDGELVDAVLFHFAASGRMVRARLCIDAGLKLHVPAQDLIILAQAVEYLHNASLIHDDLQDTDTHRRGQAALWHQFGSNAAICAGDFLISAAYRALAHYSVTAQLPTLFTAVHAQTSQAIQGQMADLTAHQASAPTLSSYLETVKQKSGALLYLPLQLAFIAARQHTALPMVHRACMDFAIGYQIIDDLEDFTQDFTSKAGTPALNIASVLCPADPSQGIPMARALCASHLQQALTLATQLPAATGEVLAALSTNLQHTLARMAT